MTHACGKWKEGVCSECRGKWRENQKQQVTIEWSSLTKRPGPCPSLLPSLARGDFRASSDKSIWASVMRVFKWPVKYKDTIFWIPLHHWTTSRWDLNTYRINLGNFWWKKNSASWKSMITSVYPTQTLLCDVINWAPRSRREGSLTIDSCRSISRSHFLFPSLEITVPQGLILCVYVCVCGAGLITLASGLWS